MICIPLKVPVFIQRGLLFYTTHPDIAMLVTPLSASRIEGLPILCHCEVQSKPPLNLPKKGRLQKNEFKALSFGEGWGEALASYLSNDAVFEVACQVNTTFGAPITFPVTFILNHIYLNSSL